VRARLRSEVRPARATTLLSGRWRGASTGVDRRAQLDQVDHVGDRHGLVLVTESALWSCAPSSAAPWRVARSAARCPAESGAEGRCAGPVGNGYHNATRTARRRRRRALIP
jgi:hypothetical protein